MLSNVLLAAAGCLAGFIDSVAGGGGLITLPLAGLTLGLGPDAVGTNKIPGSVAALVALLVYWRKGHFEWRRSLGAAVLVWLGSFLGSRASPFFPPETFHWLLVATCPMVLWLVWRRDLWIRHELEKDAAAHNFAALKSWQFFLSCLGAGFYDGAWGPGGGTLMLLALFFVGRFPLLAAIAGSKLMNLGSAVVALASYAVNGHVHLYPGVWIAAGIGVGAFTGAQFASRDAVRLVRPVLLIVVALLAWRIFTS